MARDPRKQQARLTSCNQACQKNIPGPLWLCTHTCTHRPYFIRYRAQAACARRESRHTREGVTGAQASALHRRAFGSERAEATGGTRENVMERHAGGVCACVRASVHVRVGGKEKTFAFAPHLSLRRRLLRWPFA